MAFAGSNVYRPAQRYASAVAPAVIPLGASDGVGSASLALTAPTQIPLAASAGVAAPTLSLTAPTQVPLAASAGLSSSTLALTAPTQIPLAASVGVAAPTLSLSATTQVPLASSSGVGSATLVLSAPAILLLGVLSYSQVILADTPALYWRLGEPSGTTAEDATANNRDGTYVDTPTLAQAGALAGDADTAVDFNGSSEWVNSTYNPFTNGTTRTFEGWSWRDNETNVDELFGSDAASNHVSLRMDTAGQSIRFYSSTGGTEASWTGPPWPGTAQWVHWVLIFDESANTAELFLNGVSVGSRSIATAYNASPGNFRLGLGSGSFPTQSWDGKQDEIAVYEYGLTPTQIAHHYNVGRGAGPSSAAGVASATLALSAETQLSLSASAGVAAPTLALSAQTVVALDAAAGIASATLALTAPALVALESSAGVATATLALTGPTQVLLGTSAGGASATLVLSALTLVPLDASAGVGAATLVLEDQEVAIVPLRMLMGVGT